MSKKDKKRIAKLEQQQAILAVRLATSKANFNQLVYSDYDLYNRYRAAQGLPELSQSGFEQIKPDYIFQAGTIPSGKEQEKTEQPDPILNEKMRENTVCAGRSWGKFVSFEVDEEYIKTALSRLEKEQGKTEQPQQSEAQKEQELMGQLNKELAKFASLEAFNADRKNFFLPPIDKLEFDKKKAAFDYALAAAKVLRPQWYDKIDQIKIPKEEQGETDKIEPKFSNESITPKFPDGAKVHYFGTSGREDFTTLHHIVLRYKDIFDAQLSIKGLTNLELIKQVDKMAVLFRNELHELMQSETNKGKEGQGKTEQPKPENHRENLGEPVLNKPNLPKSTLNKIVLSRIEEMEKWLGEREHSTNEIAKYIQVCVDNLQLELADFRRKLLDLGAVEQSKVEQKEAEQDGSEQPENWGIYNKNNNTLVLMIEREPCQYQTKKEAKDAIFNYFQQQRLLGKIKHYKAVLISEILKRIEQKEAEQSEPILPAPEQKEAEQIETEPTETASADAKWFYAIWADIGAGKPRLYVEKFAHCAPDKPYAHILTTQNKATAAQYDNLETARKQIADIKLHGADKLDIFGACDLRPVLICTDENAADLDKLDGSELYKSDSKDLGGAEEKEAKQDSSEQPEVWLIYDKIDKAWAAKCSDGGFYWSSKQDDFVLKFTSEAEAKERYAALRRRGLIAGMHCANSSVIRKDLGGADGADSPTRADYSYIVIVNHKRGGVPLYMLDFEHQVCDGMPDMSIETTYTKQRAYKFEHIKQAQNIIDLATGFDCFKEYNFFIDTLQ